MLEIPSLPHEKLHPPFNVATEQIARSPGVAWASADGRSTGTRSCRPALRYSAAVCIVTFED
jgi:hypothetical protein